MGEEGGDKTGKKKLLGSLWGGEGEEGEGGEWWESVEVGVWNGVELGEEGGGGGMGGALRVDVKLSFVCICFC